MFIKQCMKYNVYNTMHRKQCLWYNTNKIMNQIQCRQYNSDNAIYAMQHYKAIYRMQYLACDR